MASGGPEAAVIRQILGAIPKEWRGTTFRNCNLLGRDGFATKLNALLDGGGSIGAAEMDGLGVAEDYLRVASNFSTTFEALLARRANSPVRQYVTFASAAMPVVAVVLTAGGKTVHLSLGGAPNPLNATALDAIALLGGRLECHAGGPPPSAATDSIVLSLSEADPAAAGAVPAPAGAHGVIHRNLLVITDAGKISPAEIEIVRKRMGIPLTVPMAESALWRLAGDQVRGAEPTPPSDAEQAWLGAHLQALSGTEVAPESPPVLYTAGLPALASLWLALGTRGGADILMCSTAYGGSSQLTDLLTSRTSKLNKHTFDIQAIPCDH